VQAGSAALSSGAQKMRDTQERNWKERARGESKRFLVIFLYFWVLLSVFALHKAVILIEHNVVYDQSFAFVNALILAKAMLILEKMHVAEKQLDKPLIFQVLYKSAVFAIMLVVFYVLEEIIMGILRGKSVSQSIPVIGGDVSIEIASAGVIMFVALTPFFAFEEISRVIGEDVLFDLFFVRKGKAGK
jgi:hypothetical protein